MGTFEEKHGYAEGTYEGKLRDAGISQDTWGDYGKNVNPQEYESILAAGGGAQAAAPATPSYVAKDYEAPYKEEIGKIGGEMSGIQDQLKDLTSEEYAFDPNKFLPGIKDQAGQIYDPQQAQLEALGQLTTEQFAQARVETDEAFAKRMQQEVESMNRRGAYFSGGAILGEQAIRTEEARAGRSLTAQEAAAVSQNLAQQGQLAQDRSSFISNQLYDAESGAYNRWSDNRNFTAGALQQQYQNYANEKASATQVWQWGTATENQKEQWYKSFDRSNFESDRQYEEAIRQFDKTMEVNEYQFGKNYGLSKDQMAMAKEDHDLQMESGEFNLGMLKDKYAKTNSGWLGLNASGGDKLDQIIADMPKSQNVYYDTNGQGTSTASTPGTPYYTTTTNTTPYVNWNPNY